MATELGVGYVTLVPSAKGIVGGIEKELGAPAAAAGLSGGAKASAGFGASFKKGIKQVAVPAAIIGGVVAIGQKFEGAFATIARGTGATGGQLDSLDQSFRNVLKGGAGSFDQVSAAVTTLYQRTGLTGKALDDFAAKEVTLARITKTDVATNLQSTTGLFNLYGVAVAKQSGELDVLFRASQQGGVSITQLSSDMQAAAPTAKALGLSLDQTAALTAGIEKAGLPAGKVMLGLASSFSKAAKAGQDPVSVIHDLVKEVKAAPTATAAATIATTKFGIGARQATTLVAGLRSGAIDLNATLKGGKGINDTAAATATLSGKFAHLKNVALVGLEPLATKSLSAVTRGVTDLVPAVEFLTDHMNVLGPVLLTVAGGFIAWKTALAVKSLIDATSAGLAKLSGLLFTTSTATDAAAVSTLAEADAQQLEVAAALESAGALGIAAAAADADAVATTEATAANEAFALTPLGAVVAVAAVAVGVLTAKMHLFSHGQSDAGAATNSLIDSLLKEGKTLDDISGQVLVKAIGDNKKFSDALTALHVPLTTVSGALAGNAAAQRKLGAAVKDGLATGKISLGQFITIRDALDKNKKSLDDQKGSYDRTTAASKALGSQTDTTRLATDELRTALDLLVTSSLTNADRLRGQKEGLIGVLQSAVQLEQSTADVAAKQQALADAQDKYGKTSKEAAAATLDLQAAQLSLSGSTLAGVDNAEKFLADTVGLTGAQKQLTDAQGNSKTSAQELAADQDLVAQKQTAFKDALVKLADRVKGPLHDALLEYAGQIKTLPTKADFTALAHTQEAHDKVLKIHGEYDQLPPNKTTTVTVDTSQALHALGILKAEVHAIDPNIPLSVIPRVEGGRASGGTIKPGTWAWTGEKGPELAFGGTTGLSIMSHSKSMSALTAEDLSPHADTSGGPRAVFTGPIHAWDDRDLARKLDDRLRRSEMLAGV